MARDGNEEIQVFKVQKQLSALAANRACLSEIVISAGVDFCLTCRQEVRARATESAVPRNPLF
jgi:hypothetical protein